MTDSIKGVGISEIVQACDQLTDVLERYLAQLQNEHQTALNTGDPRFIMRVERGIGWTDELLDVMSNVLDRIGALRHNDAQLRWAREGKIV